MWDILLQNLPLAILLVLAIIICGADLIKAIGVWKSKSKEKIDKGVKDQKEKDDLNSTLLQIQESLKSLHQKVDDQEERLEKFDMKIRELTESDMHDIKSWIVEQYHKFYNERGSIDAFSADTIDHRYEDYKREGGNSYIDTLIKRLRELPMDSGSNRNNGE